MQLKALAALISVALTVGVQAAPNAFDRAAGMKDLLKRSYSHGMDMGQVSKRAMALVAKKRESNHHRRVGKRCTVPKTTPSTPAPPVSIESVPTPEQPQTTPETPETPEIPETPEPTPTPTPEPEPSPEPTKDNGNTDTGNNNNNGGSGSNNESGGTALDAIAQQWLDEHNAARAQHGAAPMTWSSELASAAQRWGSGCVFKHSGGSLGPFGENLAAQTGSMTPAQAVGMWMEEVGEYNPSSPEASHFTQVVWKKSTTLGCALVECGPGTIFDGSFGTSIYGVCEYSPAGNVIGDFADNVQK